MPPMRRRLQLGFDAAPERVRAAVERAANVEPEVETRVVVDGRRSTVELTLATDLRVPYFGWFFHPLLRRELSRRLAHLAANIRAELDTTPAPGPYRPSRVLPPVPFTQDQIRLIATVSALAALANFGGALFGQYGAPIADSFGTSDAELGAGLALTRLGILVALFSTAFADRRGRRRLILVCFAGVAVSNGISALAPGFAFFVGPQVLTRALTTATLVVAGIAVVEEAPERARAYSVALLALASGAGFAIAIVLLPLADLGSHAWRIPFLVSAATLLVLRPLARHLVETTRYHALETRHAERGRVREVFDRLYRMRFLLLALVAFLTNVFSAPTAQLTNRYLIEERDFSNTMIAVFRGVTNGLPGLFGILLAGYLAERSGRRPLAIAALAAGTIFEMVLFLGGGPVIWVASTVGIVAAACAGLAISTLSGELFPTEVRATSNAILLVCGVAGAIVGLLVATNLEGAVGSLGAGIAVCGIAPLLAAAFVLPWLPETKDRTLDTVSPSEV